MGDWEYLAVLAACLVSTAPLELLGARVWRRPRALAATVLPCVALFAVWDVFGIVRGHWRFNDRYTTGWTAPFGLPVEELLFFAVIPVCALLSFDFIQRFLREGER